MNTLGIVPLEYGVCQICQEHPATHHYAFSKRRGYGSAFDGEDIELHCCDACNRKRFAEWFGEQPTHTEEGFEQYINERDLFAFLELLPVNSQEQIWNGSDGYKIDSQDWIDLYFGELSDEKKKQYGLDHEWFDTQYDV